MKQVADFRWAFDGTFEGLIGTVYDSYAVGEVVGHFVLRAELLAPGGEAPLGLYATVAEGAASVGSKMDLSDPGTIVSGMSDDTTVTHTIADGRVNFHAKRQHQSSSLSIWSIEFRGSADVILAVSTVRIAIRPTRESQ